MEQIAPAHVDSPFHFALRAPEKTPDPLLRLKEVSVAYGERVVLAGVSLSLSPGDRIGLLGPNGAGKSTLIRLLAGQLTPRQGQREPARDLRIGYFAQHQLEQLRLEQSPLEHLRQLDPLAREQALRDYLGGFGFSADQALMPAGPFSGGEKSRLVLALLVYQRPNLLLLDEPTNHLDLEMRQALALALQDFAGAMVLVSHDRHLLRVTSDRFVLVHDGQLEEFPLSLDEYPQWLSEQNRLARVTAKEGGTIGSVAGRKEKRRLEAEQRQRLQPLRKRITATETALARLHARQAELDANLADPALYGEENKAKLKALLLEKADLDSRCEALESDWLETCEQLEALRAAN
jgi:ATP-binding cassette subfamily F protein 3